MDEIIVVDIHLQKTLQNIYRIIWIKPSIQWKGVDNF